MVRFIDLCIWALTLNTQCLRKQAWSGWLTDICCHGKDGHLSERYGQPFIIQYSPRPLPVRSCKGWAESCQTDMAVPHAALTLTFEWRNVKIPTDDNVYLHPNFMVRLALVNDKSINNMVNGWESIWLSWSVRALLEPSLTRKLFYLYPSWHELQYVCSLHWGGWVQMLVTGMMISQQSTITLKWNTAYFLEPSLTNINNFDIRCSFHHRCFSGFQMLIIEAFSWIPQMLKHYTINYHYY